MAQRTLEGCMPRMDGKDIDKLTHAELRLFVVALNMRVQELEELTKPMRRDRAIKRVLHGQPSAGDIALAKPFFDGMEP